VVRVQDTGTFQSTHRLCKRKGGKPISRRGKGKGSHFDRPVDGGGERRILRDDVGSISRVPTQCGEKCGHIRRPGKKERELVRDLAEKDVSARSLD